MVTVRPAALPVQEDANGQTAQARPKRATPPPWRAGTIGTLRLAGQVTVPASRSIRKRSLGKCPWGAVGAATLVIAVTPRWARSASSAPVP